MAPREIALHGGRVTTGIVRAGDTVRRPVSADRSLAQALLRYLEATGFAATPRFLGIDSVGREILSFLPGEVPLDLGHYDDRTLATAAGLLRRFHEATADFPAVIEANAQVMCHNDWGPPNAVFRDGLPAGIIDFDTLQPGLRLWDLGYSAASWLDLGNTDYSGNDQIRRLEVFAEGYGHADCTARLIAGFCVARQTALAAVGRRRGDTELAEWAAASASWTVENVTEQLLPTGMMPLA